MIFLARVNKAIFQALMEKIDKTPQRIYQMIDAKKKQYGSAINRATAAYILAGERGIDVSKYLDEEELAKVRDALHMGVPATTRVIQKVESKPLTIQIGKEFKITDPFLPKIKLLEASKMAEVYPYIYVFENSVRNVIGLVMERHYGKDWWHLKVSRKIKDEVERRIEKENKNRWHGKRGSHKIYYTDIGDLRAIIQNNWSEFKDIFPDISWVENKINEIELSRNAVAHNNPLTDDDIIRLKMNFKDWMKQVKTCKELTKIAEAKEEVIR